jgi:hypothetical protein
MVFDVPTENERVIMREVTTARNQCWKCLWFAPWTELVGMQMVRREPALEDNSAYTWDNYPLLERVDRYYEHRQPCANYEVTEATRNRVRCPECGHGNPNGHGRGRCIATVKVRGYYDVPDDYDECGCTYRKTIS